MKKQLLTAAFLAFTAMPALAQDRMLEGDVGLTSDYRNRGISRSDEGPALQGRIQLGHPSGLYGGVKGSTVDMNVDDDANVEAVLFGGYKGQYDIIDYDASINYTAYPDGDNDAAYWEFVITGGYDFDVFYGSLTWGISPDYLNESGVSLYYGADVSVPLGQSFTAKGHLGFQFIDDENRYAEDYAEWSLGLWYNVAEYDVDLGLEYVDTDLDDTECAENCGGRAALTARKNFAW